MTFIHDLGEGAHKMGRILLSAVCAVVSGWVSIELAGEVDIATLMAILAGINGPATTYIVKKGKGYAPKPVNESPAFDPMD